MNFLVQIYAFLANLLGIVVVGGFMIAGVIAGSIWGFGLTMALVDIWGFLRRHPGLLAISVGLISVSSLLVFSIRASLIVLGNFRSRALG